MLPVILELYRYNRWANGRALESASALTPELFIRDLGSSHGSLRDTLTHVVWGEWIWLKRWKGSSPAQVFSPTDFPSVESLRSRWAEHDAEQSEFLENLAPERLGQVVRYTNVRGESWAYPLWQQMHHVINHSSYHRGQAATLLRQLGRAPAPTDFLVFYDEQPSPTAEG